jgi:hypothetical protein
VVGKEPAGVMFANIIGNRYGSEGITFDTFVRAMKNPVIRDANPHWRPQRDFLVYKQYDDYFCLEEFDKAIPRILEKIGMPIYDARRVTGHGLDKLELIDQGNHGGLRASEILSMKLKGKCPSPRSLYNDELVAIVGEVFAEDIEVYARHFDRKGLLF